MVHVDERLSPLVNEEIGEEMRELVLEVSVVFDCRKLMLLCEKGR